MNRALTPKKSFLYLILAVLLFVGLLLSAHSVSAFPRGIINHSGNPMTEGGATCSDCHRGGEMPNVVLIGPTEVNAGETVAYTLRIMGGPAQTGGFNVSTTNGELAAMGTDTQLIEGEVTHTGPKPFDNDEVSFTFNWTAPTTPSSVVMYGAGNSTNRDFETTGDGARAVSISINVVDMSAGGSGVGDDCVIPPSGPWQPCATDGSTAGGGNGCVIPPSGPWPPCATGESSSGGSADCVIPSSGPWPPCATGEVNRPDSTSDCFVPRMGPWPECARFRID